MTAEFVSTVCEATATGDDAGSAGGGHGQRLTAVPQDIPAHDDVADAFDVHVLPVGPVVGFEEVDTGSEAVAIVDLLRRLGGHPAPHPAHGPGPAGDPAPATLKSLDEADDGLARWSGEYGEPAERRPKDRPSVLVWLGHGVRKTMGPALVVPGSKERRGDAQVTPDLFAHHLFAEARNRRAEDGHWAIVVIEACKSSDFAGALRSRFGDPPRERYSILLIATGKSGAQAYLGTFRQVLEEYLDGLSSHDEVRLWDLRRRFIEANHSCEFIGESCRELALRPRDRVPLPGATTVAEERRMQTDFDAAMPPGARPEEPPEDPGGTGFLEVAPLFTGREAELAAVRQWCAEPGARRVLIVHGAPGVGKSAFLGEALRRIREATGPGAAAGLRVGAVLRLTGSTTAQVRGQLAQVPGLSAAGPPGGYAAPSQGTAAPGPPGRMVLLADALDEARDPVHVASLLREATDHPNTLLIIGTRRTPYRDEQYPGGSRVDLPAVLGSNTERARVMELLPDPVAAADYAADGVRRVLREHSTDDPEWQETVVGTVREAVEQHVRDGSWQFLQASLVVQEIQRNPQLLSSATDARHALRRLLERDRTGLFGAAVEHITRDLPTALPFLQALALAHGRGLSRADGIWLRAAAGLAAVEPARVDRPLDERALSDFLSKAAAYVLLDGEDRRSVFRLAHRTYADRLAADVTPGQRLAMLTALLDLAAEQATEGQPLSPHLESRLAEYAADCGTPGWRELARYPAVLDRLDVAALCGLALSPGRRDGGATPADLPVEVLGTAASAHLIERSEAADRPGLRQLGGLRACGTLHPAGTGAAWEVCWGTVRRTPAHLQLGAGEMVTALAAHPGRPWLVTGTREGSVVVWEPWRTHAPVLLMRIGESPVTAVAASGATNGEGPGLLVAAYDDRTLAIWDTDAERPAPVVEETPHTIWHVTPLPDGRFAVAGDAGWLAVLEPATRRLSPALRAVDGEVVGLAPVTGPEGRQWLAVAGRTGDLTLWDVSGDLPEHMDTVRLRRPLAALTATADGTLAIAGQDGSVWLRHPAERNGTVVPMAAPEGAAPVRLGASPPVLAVWQASDGGGAIVLGDHRGLWTLREGHARQLVSGGDSAGIREVRVLEGPGGGQVVAAVVERSPAIHLWDPSVHVADTASTAPPWGPIAGMRRYITQDGTETLALLQKVRSAGRTGTAVRILRAEDGRELAEEAPHDPLATARPGWDGADGDWPAAVEREHRGDVLGWVPLRGEPWRGVRASADHEGDVVVWREGADGSWQPTHRVRLGSSGLGLTALSGGRLAVALRDGVVVLAVGTGAFDSGNEEMGDDDV
ncbi:hypothetical protein JBE04_13005 [Streptomyces sp. PRKS01-29]|nr:AAA family ATPase [Streptomyces sabulosicollis]MBI0295354.1 hypothetical protein [Streptomyces sabulosicollis]